MEQRDLARACKGGVWEGERMGLSGCSYSQHPSHPVLCFSCTTCQPGMGVSVSPREVPGVDWSLQSELQHSLKACSVPVPCRDLERM